MLVTLVEPDVVVDTAGGALRCLRGREVLRVLRPHTLDALHLHGSANLTPAARGLLLRLGVDVAFLTRDGRVLGRLEGPLPPGGDRRLRQLVTALDPGRRLAVARQVVAGKVHNQRALLLSRRLGASDPAAVALEEAQVAAERAADLDVLRGVEGMAARRYFEGFQRLLKRDDVAFDGRTRRPPRDPVNALLSYGYAILLSRVEGAVRAAALDPYVGFLHDAGRGAPALALDLVEEWRPMVDGVVLTLLNLGQLGPDDFRVPLPEELGAEPEDDVDAVYLGRVAVTVLVRAWERQIRRTVAHPETGASWTARDLFRGQALQVARAVAAEVPTYQAVRLFGS